MTKPRQAMSHEELNRARAHGMTEAAPTSSLLRVLTVLVIRAGGRVNLRPQDFPPEAELTSWTDEEGSLVVQARLPPG